MQVPVVASTGIPQVSPPSPSASPLSSFLPPFPLVSLSSSPTARGGSDVLLPPVDSSSLIGLSPQLLSYFLPPSLPLTSVSARQGEVAGLSNALQLLHKQVRRASLCTARALTVASVLLSYCELISSKLFFVGVFLKLCFPSQLCRCVTDSMCVFQNHTRATYLALRLLAKRSLSGEHVAPVCCLIRGFIHTCAVLMFGLVAGVYFFQALAVLVMFCCLLLCVPSVLCWCMCSCVG